MFRSVSSDSRRPDPRDPLARIISSLSRDVARVNAGGLPHPVFIPIPPLPLSFTQQGNAPFVPPGRRTPAPKVDETPSQEQSDLAARVDHMTRSTPHREVKTATVAPPAATVTPKKSPWTVQKTSSKLPPSRQPVEQETLEQAQKSAMRLKNSQKELIVLEKTLEVMKNLLLKKETLSIQENELLEKSADFVAAILDVKLPLQIIYSFAKSAASQMQLTPEEIKDLAATVRDELVIKQQLTKQEEDAAAECIYIEQVNDEIADMKSKIEAMRKREYYKMKAFVIEARLASRCNVTAADLNFGGHKRWSDYARAVYANLDALQNNKAPISVANHQMSQFGLFSPMNIPVSREENMKAAEFHSLALSAKQP